MCVYVCVLSTSQNQLATQFTVRNNCEAYTYIHFQSLCTSPRWFSVHIYVCMVVLFTYICRWFCLHICVCMCVCYASLKITSLLNSIFCRYSFLFLEICIERASVNLLDLRRSKEDFLKTQLEIQFTKYNIHKTFTKSWHLRESMGCVYTYMYTCVYACLNRSSKVLQLLNLLSKITMTEMTFTNHLKLPNIKCNQNDENFSKVSLLLNLLYTMTRELTFENDFTSG